MKLVPVSDTRIVDAESGNKWDFDPAGCIFPGEEKKPKLYLNNSVVLIEEQAAAMWAWMLRHLAP